MSNLTNIDPAAAGAAGASPAAEAEANEQKAVAITGASDVAGFRKAGVVADLIGGRLNSKVTPLFLDTAAGMRRVQYVRQFSDGPWLVTGGSNALDQQSFAVTLLDVLFSKAATPSQTEEF